MNNENFFLAVVLSIAILVGFHYLYEKPMLEKQQKIASQQIGETEENKQSESIDEEKTSRSREEIIQEEKSLRIPIKTPELRGSINLKGARIDDLELVNYRETTEPNSKNIILLSPAGAKEPHTPYYVEFGWLAKDVETPNNNTIWRSRGDVLEPGKPLKLEWTNSSGLIFERTFSVDEHFMFTISDSIKNEGNSSVTLYPFGLISRWGKPITNDTYILHEGPLGVLEGTLKEYKYKELMEVGKEKLASTGGWLGITDKYWLVALVPPQNEKILASFAYSQSNVSESEKGVFQTDFRGSAVTLAPGAFAEKTTQLFAGAKRVRLLDDYKNKYNIPLFDRAIDFGWYYYLTKPFLYLLDFLGTKTGNFGIAIVIFTILLRLLTLPLSLKSYRSMARMKALQPQLKAIQERYKDDKQRQGIEMMELYKREKTNPLSGCLPTLIQIPIFFALYKVLYVGIELRHAPLFWWVKDLSAPDPTSVLTLFGILDWGFIPHVGVWPVLMGISMFLQQKLSPAPPDKTQAQVFAFLPIIFTFMLAKVAVGLIFYWTFSNVIGIAQQWYIMYKTEGGKKV